MNLQNDYKVLYEKAADGKRTFYASKTGLFEDAEVIAEIASSEYKLIYEKNGKIFGSITGVPAADDYRFAAFDAVLATATEATDVASVEDPANEVEDEPVDEEPVEDEAAIVATEDEEEPAEE